MTDQVRREESAESELQHPLLDAADAPAAQSEAATPGQTAGAAAQPTPETTAGASEAVMVEPSAATPVAAETTATPVTPAMSAAHLSVVAGASGEGDGELVTAASAEETAASPSAKATAEQSGPPATATSSDGVETTMPASEEAPVPTVAAGASFVPVAEEETRPRKLKDLQPGMELEGRVTSIALYGIFVDIGVGRDGLVHISEMSDTRIETPSDLVQIGDTVRVRVKSVDLEAKRISLTMRTGAGEKGEGARGGRGRSRRAEIDKERLASLKVGDLVEGVITGYAPFGAFADIGVGKDGLIHVSELAEGRVEKPEDAVKVGDRLQFKVLEVDPEGARISLSLRRAQRSQKMQGLEVGQILEGTVSGIAPFGAFVDIGVGRDGLVHISALANTRVNRVEDVVKVGDKVRVKVLEVDHQSKRISLTMRLEEPPPPAEVEAEEAPEKASPPPRPSTPPAASARFASAAEARAGRDRERERRERRERERRNVSAQTETYTSDDFDEEFVGDATLEDLLTKFGGPSTSRRDRRGSRRGDDFDDEGEERFERRQRDAIRRTLQQVGRDE
ncbi:MAG: S1 RNA-binding domain-containing protein [Oscillochloridaceae bacterium]|nr:S1 RNA-binding domain-containing protein [Chloroflexaceae bacterium]MDW8389934.1 S1 RNA-binding domain-containing protein [Oscillochloridaceae bacterium]